MYDQEITSEFELNWISSQKIQQTKLIFMKTYTLLGWTNLIIVTVLLSLTP